MAALVPARLEQRPDVELGDAQHTFRHGVVLSDTDRVVACGMSDPNLPPPIVPDPDGPDVPPNPDNPPPTIPEPLPSE